MEIFFFTNFFLRIRIFLTYVLLEMPHVLRILLIIFLNFLTVIFPVLTFFFKTFYFFLKIALLIITFLLVILNHLMYLVLVIFPVYKRFFHLNLMDVNPFQLIRFLLYLLYLSFLTLIYNHLLLFLSLFALILILRTRVLYTRRVMTIQLLISIT